MSSRFTHKPRSPNFVPKQLAGDNPNSAHILAPWVGFSTPPGQQNNRLLCSSSRHKRRTITFFHNLGVLRMKAAASSLLLLVSMVLLSTQLLLGQLDSSTPEWKREQTRNQMEDAGNQATSKQAKVPKEV